ncbi:eCIS core domain-containing protein [Baaleninema sp.]|uniref:eCIS core domain-containing protein n=1 Tax=Baaleninema sp. TaxID=3101197 RepID=UPI003D00CA32
MPRHSRFAVYLGGLLGCLSAGVFLASLSSLVSRACYSPETPLGQVCRGQVPDGIPEPVLANMGALAYRTIAEVMERNHDRPQSLDDTQKAYLRPYFGDLVDRVRIVYDAQLMDNWVGANLRIDLGYSNAQVYGYRIYVNESYRPDNLEQITLLAHELIHVRQSEELGGLGEFGYQYFLEYKRADRVYENNIFEKEAFAFEKRFTHWLQHNREHREMRR